MKSVSAGPGVSAAGEPAGLAAGAMKVGRVALDGTKVKANASKHKAMSYGRMQEQEEQIREEINQLLAQAEAADREEDERYGKESSGEELPAELERRQTRLKKIRRAKRALEQRAREKAPEGGHAVKEAQPEEKDQYNFTDPESRIMKGGDGFVQGYHAQGGRWSRWPRGEIRKEKSLLPAAVCAI